MVEIGQSAGHDTTLPVPISGPGAAVGRQMIEDVTMRGYDSSSYGEAFADVYDDWYRDVSDIDATVDALHRLSHGGHVLELGVGTGRLALPLAARGCQVTGVDSSPKMLDRLISNDPARTVLTVHGDMVDDIPPGPFDIVFTAYNTIFNLLTPQRQQDCFDRSAAVLAPDGCLVIEAFVPQPHTGSQVSVRSMAADRVVLSASVHDAGQQRAEGQFIEFTDNGGVRLRPWAIRYAAPAELDSMAAQAGLTLKERWSSFGAEQFDDTSEQHVSIYERVDRA